MAKKVIESVQEDRDPKLYEFAFHLVPKMSADDAVSAFTDIKNQITATGATIKNESAPALLNLEYTMDHTVESVRSKYNQAYFAWIILSATGSQIETLTEDIKLRNDIVRHLLITTKNESPLQASEVAAMVNPKEVKTFDEEHGEIIEEVEDVVSEEVAEDTKADEAVDEAIEKLTE